MSAAPGSFSAALRRQLVERDVSTGLQFATCARMLPILGVGRPADGLGRGTISEATSARPMDGTISVETISGPEAETIIEPSRETIISGRRGRPRKGEERGTITALKPWEAEGLSRRTWYRRRIQINSPAAR